MIVESHSHVALKLEGVEETPNWYGRGIEKVDEYLCTYRLNNVDACWVFGCKGWLDSATVCAENEALSRLGDAYPSRLYPWGTVNPNWPEHRLRAEIRRLGSELRLYGIKLVPVLAGAPLSGPGMDVVADEAINVGIPVFFHDGSPEYCSAIQVVYFARKHPKLRVVAGHGGLRDLWSDHMRCAKDVPNLWICLSGPTQWGIQKLYDALGPDRLLWGSDGGLGTPAVVTAYLRRIERLKAPARHKDMILGENAMRFLFGNNWKERIFRDE